VQIAIDRGNKIQGENHEHGINERREKEEGVKNRQKAI